MEAGQCSTASRASAPCAARPTGRGVRLQCRSQYDHSARVKGGVQRVFKYVSDVQHLPQWYPGVTAVNRVRGKGPELGSQYEVDRKIMQGVQHKSFCEIVDLEVGKKVVVSATSQWYNATHEFYFMAHPTDLTFTNIRYIKRLQLRSAAGALQPLLSGFFKKIPEEGLGNLVRMLNRPDSPLRYIALDAAEEEEEMRSTKGKWAPGNWQSMWQGLGLGPLPTPASGSTFVDSLGYYSILGLDPKRHSRYSADEIKVAYRRAAMELHPDRIAAMATTAGADSTRKMASATLMFQRLQKAYEVLKNPEHKQLYDSGELLEELVR